MTCKLTLLPKTTGMPTQSPKDQDSKQSTTKIRITTHFQKRKLTRDI
jgi:hypothetical protein